MRSTQCLKVDWKSLQTNFTGSEIAVFLVLVEGKKSDRFFYDVSTLQYMKSEAKWLNQINQISSLKLK